MVSTVRGWLLGVMIGSGVLVTAGAEAKLARTGDAEVVAHATATAGMKIKATTQELRVTEGPDAITLSVPVATLKTGIGLRDRHLRDKYLEANRFPNVEVVVKRSALTFPADGQAVTGEAPATMTLHGQTKPVALRYAARRAGDSYSVRGNTTIDITEFGIKQPSYLRVTVNRQVTVEVRFQVTDK